jgi:transcriptional regulator with XRE-family HTH domain
MNGAGSMQTLPPFEPRISTALGILELLKERCGSYYAVAARTGASEDHISRIVNKQRRPRYDDIIKWVNNAGLFITPWGLVEKDELGNCTHLLGCPSSLESRGGVNPPL